MVKCLADEKLISIAKLQYFNILKENKKWFLIRFTCANFL